MDRNHGLKVKFWLLKLYVIKKNILCSYLDHVLIVSGKPYFWTLFFIDNLVTLLHNLQTHRKTICQQSQSFVVLTISAHYDLRELSNWIRGNFFYKLWSSKNSDLCCEKVFGQAWTAASKVWRSLLEIFLTTFLSAAQRASFLISILARGTAFVVRLLCSGSCTSTHLTDFLGHFATISLFPESSRLVLASQSVWPVCSPLWSHEGNEMC